MGALNRIIINDISDGNINTFRVDQSNREKIIYGIDVPDAQDINVFSEKGKIKFFKEIVGSRTIIRFENKTGFYGMTYTKPNFIKDDGGIYTYSEIWDAPERTLVLFSLPPYSVLINPKKHWEVSKTEQNNLLLDWIGSGTLKANFQYQINSKIFSEQEIRLVDGTQLQIHLFYKPQFFKKAINASAEILDWLQRFQSLYILIKPLLDQDR